MKAWIGHHLRSAGDAIRRLAAAPLGTALSLLMISTSIALPVGAYVVLHNLRTLSVRVTGDPQMSVFLATDATRGDIDRVAAKLQQAPAAARVVFVGKDDALAGLKRNEALAPAIGTLKENPLPDAFIVHLKDGSPGAAEALADTIRGEAKVATVQLDSAWLRRLDAVLALVGAAVAVLGAILAGALVTAIFGAIRTQIAGRVDEIAVLRLVGATENYIRRPFLYVGGGLGLMGAAGALVIVHVALALLDRPVLALAKLYESEYSLTRMSLMDMGSVLIAGAVLGVVGAMLAAREARFRAPLR